MKTRVSKELGKTRDIHTPPNKHITAYLWINSDLC